MDALRQALTSFTPLNDEEARDKEVILSSLQNGTEDFTPNVFNRSWPSHFTTSAWVVDPSKTQTLMVYHNIYNSWSWIGGHADGDTNLTRVTMRELKEETGLQEARLISDDIFSCEVLTVNGHWKRGEYVPSHLHLNITYLFEADPSASLHIAPDENSGVSWFDLDEIPNISKEPWMIQHIYQKLIHRTQLFC